MQIFHHADSFMTAGTWLQRFGHSLYLPGFPKPASPGSAIFIPRRIEQESMFERISAVLRS
jgi:hypothetical protein